MSRDGLMSGNEPVDEDSEVGDHPDETLRNLADVASAIGPALQPFSADQRLQRVVETARRAFGARACSIAILDAEQAMLEFRVTSGEGAAELLGTGLSTGRAAQFSVFHRLADEAYFANTALVCAVNNLALPSYPSEFAAVISVASAQGSDPFTYYYNPHPPMEFGAPGIDLEVAWLHGSTVTATGNSFACPHITGLVARLLSKHPGLTPFRIKTVLHSLASNRAAG